MLLEDILELSPVGVRIFARRYYLEVDDLLQEVSL